MIVVDTSVLSGALGRKRPGQEGREALAIADFKRLLRSNAAIGVPGIVYQELLSRIADRGMFERLRSRLQGLTMMIADEDDHALAAVISNDCLRAGVTAATVDCLIAATTIRAGARLLTTDPDFTFIARCCRLELCRS